MICFSGWFTEPEYSSPSVFEQVPQNLMLKEEKKESMDRTPTVKERELQSWRLEKTPGWLSHS